MTRLWALVFGTALVFSGTAYAAERVLLGYGNIINNDFFGDGHDRWRSGSISSSWIFGRDWSGQLPERPGEIIEFRLQGEVIQPQNLSRPLAADRPYAGQFSLGLHTHYQMQGYEVSLGGGFSLVGPQTGLDRLQGDLHALLGANGPSAITRARQIRDQLQGNMVVEIGRDLDLGGRISLRPFVEARAGSETLIRGGFDLMIGSVGRDDLLVRDPVTGHRYRTISSHAKGKSLVIGADFAHVSDSIYLPESRGYTLTDSRNRLRAGVHWQGERNAFFYGVTWLGKEFTSQSEGQTVGSVRLDFRF